MLFFTVLITVILAGAEIDLFTPSFPELERTFHLTPFTLQLMLSLNFLGYAVSTVWVGLLGDRYGRRPIILLSLLIFITGSVLCVTASHYTTLLAGRLLQGLGMSGPMTLGYVVIADQYPPHKQTHLLGLLNGFTASSMAFAPVLGSYINEAWGWRGNFMTLLTLGLASFLLCWAFIPASQPVSSVRLTLTSYIPLLRSKNLRVYILGIGLMTVSYWVFIGISPILYMDDLGVPLKSFGFYQGANAACFAITSMISPLILRKFERRTCLRAGTWVAWTFACTCLMASLWFTDHPLVITLLMCGYAIGLVFPCNILYPLSLEVIPDAKGRISALHSAFRLVVSGVALQVIGYSYSHTFFSVATYLAVFTTLSLILVRKIPLWKSSRDEYLPSSQETCPTMV